MCGRRAISPPATAPLYTQMGFAILSLVFRGPYRVAIGEDVVEAAAIVYSVVAKAILLLFVVGAVQQGKGPDPLWFPPFLCSMVSPLGHTQYTRIPWNSVTLTLSSHASLPPLISRGSR